jgi:hypothetical protein
MKLTLTDATARLSTLVRENLLGAELQEFRLVEEYDDESAYVVRWSRDIGRGRTEYGTHRAAINIEGGMLLWGHYTRDEADACRDYQERT